jgi:tetratricopeptide (TPR) repeat protein
MSPDQEKRLNELREAAHKLLVADYFVALGVARTASPEDVKKAFVEAAKTWHPDRVPSGLEEARPLLSKVFARLELARATLSDPARRKHYLDELAKPVTAATAGDISSAEATLEFRKAEALLKKHDAAGAEAHLRKAVQLAPSNVEYQVLLVWLQVKPDSTPSRLKELAADLDRLIGRESTSERGYFYRGQVRKRLDQLDKAHADFVRAAELNPGNVDAAREVRIYNMRKEKAAPAASADEGVGGFFKKLFKR